jgi:hypothetical protein
MLLNFAANQISQKSGLTSEQMIIEAILGVIREAKDRAISRRSEEQ